MGLFGKKTQEKKEEMKDAVQETPAKDVKDDKKDATSAQSKTKAGSYSVLVAPMITEKSHALSRTGKYVFRVARNATKRTVKHAVEDTYDVHVEGVHMVKIPAKRRTVKQDRGYQKVGKKAIVTLRTGETIASFETV